MSPLDDRKHDEFLRLFTSHESAIRAFVRHLVPTRQNADDVMQETALVLWKKFDQCAGPQEFRKWAFTVARYEALAWRRDKSRDRLVLAEEVVELLAAESAQSDARLEAQRDALDICLRKLPADRYRLLIAAYTPGAAMDAIARQSGRTLNAFYQWLHRIRADLLNCTRRELASQGGI